MSYGNYISETRIRLKRSNLSKPVFLKYKLLILPVTAADEWHCWWSKGKVVNKIYRFKTLIVNCRSFQLISTGTTMWHLNYLQHESKLKDHLFGEDLSCDIWIIDNTKPNLYRWCFSTPTLLKKNKKKNERKCEISRHYLLIHSICLTGLVDQARYSTR